METFDFCFETVLDVADKHKKATDDEDGISHLARVTYEAEKAHIKKILKSTKGSKTHAAALLGISRKTLWKKIKTYNIETV
jgi:transcriptional regulator with PAS, ATPase and Fis domain